MLLRTKASMHAPSNESFKLLIIHITKAKMKIQRWKFSKMPKIS